MFHHLSSGPVKIEQFKGTNHVQKMFFGFILMSGS